MPNITGTVTIMNILKATSRRETSEKKLLPKYKLDSHIDAVYDLDIKEKF